MRNKAFMRMPPGVHNSQNRELNNNSPVLRVMDCNSQGRATLRGDLQDSGPGPV